MKADLAPIAHRDLDQRIEPLKAARPAAVRPAEGWIRAVRTALGLTQDFVAKRLGTKRQAFAQLEDAELRGASSLRSLERAAEAMDCELVYFMVPRGGSDGSFSELARRFGTGVKPGREREPSLLLDGQPPGHLPEKPPATDAWM